MKRDFRLEIKCCLEDAAREMIEGSNAANRPWTNAIKRNLTKLGKSHNFQVCCSGLQMNGIDSPNWGEWLYDLCWLKSVQNDDHCYESMPLALESEWSMSLDDIVPDFQKLVFSRAETKIMIWQETSIEPDLISKALVDQIVAAGDESACYLLACLRGNKFYFTERGSVT